MYFTIANGYNVEITFNMSCNPSGVVTDCSPESETLTLPAFGSINDFQVSYTVANSVGTGRFALTASNIASDSGWYNVTAAHPSAPTLTQPRQPDSVFSRAHCVISSAGVADWSCGDALFMLSTPSYTTLDRARNLTLTYASSTASPHPLVSANVGLFSEPPLDRVTAVLTVGGTVRSTATYLPWSDDVRQIVMGWDASALATGAYPYTLTTYAVSGTDSTSGSVSGVLPIINRGTGPYGAGWEWLGVERLILNQPVGSGQAHILWVDGDGSSKLYRQINSTTWVAPPEAYRDTIVLASGEYTRTLRHGVQVVFDNTGRHIRTTNRQTQITNFFWRSATQLDSVRVPPAGAGGKTFILHYDGANKLDSVRVGGRDVGVSIGSGNLTQWRWPDTTYLSFHTASNGLIDSTTDVRGGKTVLHYGNHGLVDTAKVLYDSASSHLASVTAFRPWQSVGYAGSAPGDTSKAFISIIGPRGAGDSAQFRVDRFGAPISVFDADHQTTKYTRGDGNVPALITRIDFPNARRQLLTYNARGNLTSLIDSTWGVNAFAKQRSAWSYGDANDLDSPSQVIAPDSTISQFTYNSLGLTATMTDPRHHLTSYAYQGSGASTGQLISVTEDSVLTWIEAAQVDSLRPLVSTITRDSSGNAVKVQNPAGGQTKYLRDATFGQVTQVDNALGFRTQYQFDKMGRTARQVALHAAGDATNGCANQREFICGDSAIVAGLNPAGDSGVTTLTYTSGLLTRVRDPRGVARSYRYDLRGLLVAEVDESGRADSTVYDRGGLIAKQITRNGDALTYRKDASGRDTLWVMPPKVTFMFDSNHTALADTVRSQYDSLGNLLVHRSRLGDITRKYSENGTLKSEVRHAAATGAHLVPDSVQMGFDRFGRLDTLRWRGGDTVRYRYSTSGDIDSVYVDWKSGSGTQHERFGFHWDSLGRRQQVKYPYNSMSATTHYDRLGVIRRMTIANSANLTGNRFVDTLIQDKVDLLGRPLHKKMLCPGMSPSDSGNPCGELLPSDDTTKYNRVGQVVVQALIGLSSLATDTFKYDLSGNRIYHAYAGASAVRSWFTYADSSNRLSVQGDSLANASGRVNRYFVYDSLGSRRVMFTIDAPHDTVVQQIYQYDAAGRMMGSAYRISLAPDLKAVAANTCNYDPDTRAVQPCGAGAVSLLGEQVIHDPNGNWFYVYAPGLDNPILAIRRSNVDTTETARLDIVTDGMGQVVAMGDSNGVLSSTYAFSVPGSNGGPWGSGITKRAQTFDPRRWATAVGADTISTFRTRQYDPAAGKWLQEDPIGVAGGVNLYQYNGNDPNSFSDPFGLDTLTTNERGKLGRLCREADCGKIQVHRGTDSKVANAVRKGILKASEGRSVTIGNDIYLSDRDKGDFGALAHEVTHAWQFQRDGAGAWWKEAIGARIDEMRGRDPYAYSLNGRPFGRYGFEQQAQMIQNCVNGSRGACWGAGFPGEGGHQ